MYIPTSSSNTPLSPPPPPPPPSAIIDLFKNVRPSILPPSPPDLDATPNQPLILTTKPLFLSSSDLPLPALSPLVFFLIALLSAFIVTLVIRVAMLAQRRQERRARWQRGGYMDEEFEDEGEYADDEMAGIEAGEVGMRGVMGLQRGKIFLGADEEVVVGVSIMRGEDAIDERGAEDEVDAWSSER